MFVAFVRVWSLMIPPSLFLWAYGGYLIVFVNDINLDRSAWIILDLTPDPIPDRVRDPV